MHVICAIIEEIITPNNISGIKGGDVSYVRIENEKECEGRVRK